LRLFPAFFPGKFLFFIRNSAARIFFSWLSFTLIPFSIREKIWVRKEKSFSHGKRLSFPENDKRRDFGMKNNNQINVPQAREAMDKFKMQAASEVGVNLTNGYNGHLTSREAGSVGGQMVKKMIEAYEQGLQ